MDSSCFFVDGGLSSVPFRCCHIVLELLKFFFVLNKKLGLGKVKTYLRGVSVWFPIPKRGE